MNRVIAIFSVVCILFFMSASYAATLSPDEQKIAHQVTANQQYLTDLLQRTININSGTFNLDGVKQVGQVYNHELDQLGFQTEWINLPEQMQRAGHLFAYHRGSQGKRILLLAHMDTVFPKDSSFNKYQRNGDIIKGPGVVDDKGGIAVVLTALKALHELGYLENAQITVAITGDEEMPGQPLSVSREAVINAAKNSDIVLSFELSDGMNTGVIARRGIAMWILKVQSNAGHSSLIFGDERGYGANYSLAHLLEQFRQYAVAEPYLTLNPGIILGGTSIDVVESPLSAHVTGRQNVIAETAEAQGDIRYLTEESYHKSEQALQAMVKRSLPNTTAQLAMGDTLVFPPMPPTAENKTVLATLSQVNQDLGFGPMEAMDPLARGAADINFVAKYAAGLDGLGAVGGSDHSVDEYMELAATMKSTQRLAVALYRLTR